MSRHPAVSFVAPYRIYVPEEFFEVRIGDGTARVKASPLPPIASASTSQLHGQHVEIAHDVFGFAGRTRFYVVLDEVVDITNPAWKQIVCTCDNEIVATALRAVNRVLAVYRDQDVNRVGESSFHVIELVRGDLSDISLVVVDNDFNQVAGFAINWPGYRTIGFGSAVMREPAVAAAIRTYLANGIEIPIERELLVSAQNHFWRRQLRLVPVEANTAFESYANSALKKALRGTTLPESVDLFRKLQALDKSLSDAAATSSKQFARWFNPVTKGWKSLVNAELKQWHDSCYELRNKVIHRGYNEVTVAEADAAIKYTQAAIGMIDRWIIDLIP